MLSYICWEYFETIRCSFNDRYAGQFGVDLSPTEMSRLVIIYCSFSNFLRPCNLWVSLNPYWNKLRRKLTEEYFASHSALRRSLIAWESRNIRALGNNRKKFLSSHVEWTRVGHEQRPRRSPTWTCPYLSAAWTPTGVPGITSSRGCKRCLGDWWFKRWETISDPGGDNRDPARWSAIKCRHEDRAQPVVIDTRSSIFLFSPFPPYREGGHPRETPVCCPARDHDRPQIRPVVRRGGLRRRRRDPGAAENLPEADTRRRSPWWVYPSRPLFRNESYVSANSKVQETTIPFFSR